MNYIYNYKYKYSNNFLSKILILKSKKKKINYLIKMSEQTIKNPFGDSISMSPSNEESDSNNNINLSHSTPQKNDDFQEDIIKNKLAENGISEDTLKFGINMGKQIVKNSKFVDYFSLEGLKPYFDVDNKYVLYKFRYLFIPFLKEKQINTSEEYENKYKIEYFDLYLPLMSFITYVLVVSFISAIENPGVFNPQTLGKILSQDFSLYIINVMAIKLLMFIFLNNPLSFLDICSLVGYKFVHMILYKIIRNFIEEKKIKYIVFFILVALLLLFMKKCLDKRLSNENFKNIIIYLTLAADFCTMSLIILFDR